MRKLNYKHTKSGAIISPTCFNKVPNKNKDHFTYIEDEPTHYVVDDDETSDFAMNLLEAEITTDIVDDVASNFDSSDTSSESFGDDDFEDTVIALVKGHNRLREALILAEDIINDTITDCKILVTRIEQLEKEVFKLKSKM